MKQTCCCGASIEANLGDPQERLLFQEWQKKHENCVPIPHTYPTHIHDRDILYGPGNNDYNRKPIIKFGNPERGIDPGDR